MAEETAQEVVDPNTTAAAAAAVDMDVENVETCDDGGESKPKRLREDEESKEEKDDGVSKKPKVDEEKSVEEERLEKLEEEDDVKEVEGEEEKEASGPVNLGFKSFGSSVAMFDYFYQFLHAWPLYVNVNKYEHKMLLELLKNGHQEPHKKIGQGVRAFQVRNHPAFKSKCFFLIREDDSVDDFSFRKCVHHILPLPEEMHSKFDAKKPFGGGVGGGGRHHGGKGGGRGRGGRGGGRGGHGHGKGGRWRH